MRLKEYLEKYGTPKPLLAKKANISLSTLSKVVYGTEPTLRIAAAIEDATHGEVSMREMIRLKGELSPGQKARKKVAEENGEASKESKKKKSD